MGRSPVEALGGMVCSSQPLATQAGLEILRAGGSAVDAAIGAAAVQSVTEPMSTGLGGDAFVLGYDQASKTLYGLNGSGRAPARADADALWQAGHRRMPMTGIHATTVPGTVDTWGTLHGRYGVLPLARILQAAVHYAEDGFPVAQITARAWKGAEAKLRTDPEARRLFLLGGGDGRAPTRGEVHRNPDLAHTLKAIGSDGPRVVYEGEVARAIVAACDRRGGWIGEEDLRNHHSEWVTPLSRRFAGYEVCELPPNGQGMFALEILGILDRMDVQFLGFGASGEAAVREGFPIDALHALVEAIKIAFADRAAYLAEPDPKTGSGVPVEALLSDAYLGERSRDIQLARAHTPKAMHGLSGDTVYLCVVDEAGNAVSFIQSLFQGFGSAVGVETTGIVLQNRGAGFTLEKGHPNRLTAGHRPLHTIIPGMVLLEGRPYMPFGVMGGDMQPQGHAQILLHHLIGGLDVQAAGEAPRVFFDPDRSSIALESGYDGAVRRELLRRGHRIEEAVGVFGGYQAIRIDPETGVRSGGSDPRKDGQAAGY